MNLTDTEIIKALDGADLFLRNRATSKPAPLNEYDIEELLDIAKVCDEAANLINRKKAVNELSAKEVVDLKIKVKEQKAEIERLHEVINGFEEQSHKELLQFYELSGKYENAKSEAIKEFADRLKEKAMQKFDWNEYIEVEDIADLEKEMVGE